MIVRFIRKIVPILVLGLLVFPSVALAVPPPDFLIALGAQVAYVFSFVAVFLTAAFGILGKYLLVKFRLMRAKPAFSIIGGLLLIVLVSSGVAYAYSHYQQQAEYDQWLIESEAQQVAFAQWEPVEKVPETDNEFFNENRDMDMSVSNEDFQVMLDTMRDDILILDTREDIEYKIGRFEGSIHHRYADLKAGKWRELPKDKYIVVLCWSGVRSHTVATYLRKKGLMAIFLDDGADGWVESGGEWDGEIKFSKVYNDKRFSQTYSTEFVREKESEGTILVSVMAPDDFAADVFDYHIPFLDTSSEELEDMYKEIPTESEVITVCNNYTNCFIAKLVGVELENRGHKFIGRYNKPWNY